MALRTLRSKSLRWFLFANAVLVGSLAPSTQTAAAEWSGQPRFQAVDPNVTLQRYAETVSEEAVVNLPVLSGDRIWTDRSGRADIQLPDGSFLLLGPQSRLDIETVDDSDARAVLQLWSGSVVVGRVDHGDGYEFRIVTENGEVTVDEHALVRIDAFAGETRVAVLQGEAEALSADRRQGIEGGNESWMRDGYEPTRTQEVDERYSDSLDSWATDRWRELDYRGESREYLPEPLYAYGAEFDTYGSWRNEVGVGSVWCPRVAVGWQPYRHGRWSWTPYGWNWVPAERWGWAVSHYGSWDFSVTFGWYWVPGRNWGPAHVVWGHSGRYVGWCPRGRNGHAAGYGHGGRFGGHGDRNSFGAHWTFVGSGDMRHRDVSRARIDHAALRSGAVRIADSSRMAPSRDGRELVTVPDVSSTRAELRQPRPRPNPSDGRFGEWGRQTAAVPSRRSGGRPSPFGDSSTEVMRRRPRQPREGEDGTVTPSNPGGETGSISREPRRSWTRPPFPGSEEQRSAEERRGTLRTPPVQPERESAPRADSGASVRTPPQRAREWPRLERPSSTEQRGRADRSEPRTRAPERRPEPQRDSPRSQSDDGWARSQPRQRSEAPAERPRIETSSPSAPPRRERREAPPRVERPEPASRQRSEPTPHSRDRSPSERTGQSERGGGARRRGSE